MGQTMQYGEVDGEGEEEGRKRDIKCCCNRMYLSK